MQVQVLYQNWACFAWASCCAAETRAASWCRPARSAGCLAWAGLLHTRLSTQPKRHHHSS